ncbi:MAG: hypothetical protein Q9218_004855 [Villophora microphyllina]
MDQAENRENSTQMAPSAAGDTELPNNNEQAKDKGKQKVNPDDEVVEDSVADSSDTNGATEEKRKDKGKQRATSENTTPAQDANRGAAPLRYYDYVEREEDGWESAAKAKKLSMEEGPTQGPQAVGSSRAVADAFGVVGAIQHRESVDCDIVRRYYEADASNPAVGETQHGEAVDPDVIRRDYEADASKVIVGETQYSERIDPEVARKYYEAVANAATASNAAVVEEKKVSLIKKPRARNTRVGDDDHLEFEVSKDHWIRAVWHHQIRHQLIEEAAQVGEGQWRHEWGHTDDEDDITAYFPNYKDWGSQRENWPDILFRYRCLNCHVPKYTPEDWYREGRIVLSPDGSLQTAKPVLQWEHLPTTISSNITAAEHEALWRLDRRMTTTDLIARMPLSVHQLKKAKKTVDTYNVRRGLARIEMCCRSWNNTKRSANINAYLDSKLPKENYESNDTRSFRLLTNEEVEEAKKQNPAKQRKAKTSEAEPKALTHENIQYWIDRSMADPLPRGLRHVPVDQLRAGDWRWQLPRGVQYTEAQQSALRRGIKHFCDSEIRGQQHQLYAARKRGKWPKTYLAPRNGLFGAVQAGGIWLSDDFGESRKIHGWLTGGKKSVDRKRGGRGYYFMNLKDTPKKEERVYPCENSEGEEEEEEEEMVIEGTRDKPAESDDSDWEVDSSEDTE